MRKSPLETRPERRPLRIFAFDPMISRAGDHRVTVEIPYRPIERNERYFRDDRLEVVDYDAATNQYYRAVDLNNPAIAMTQGLEPLEQDPQFHQQMVYAVASKVLENFDRALGRRLRFRGGDRLRLFPHAFQARNAYFDEDLNAVLFGYFPADEDDPGPNLPGQLIFTCLSHDIVVHEVSHAALNRIHGYYNEPTNAQVPALHEAFADIVAMFQRLTFPEVVAPALREARGDLLNPNNRLLDVGAQFGSAAGKGGPLRRIAGKPDPAVFARTKEPHDLGWILVSAVYEGFVSTCVRRSRDLLRLATGGSGQLPEGELHPDLVNRLTQECVRTAQAVLSMCIRATDYLPPVDPTFSDFLRAMVTADFELTRSDDSGLRADMIEAFRQRGIHPQAVGSLAVPSLLLEAEDSLTPKSDPVLAEIVKKLLGFGARQLDRNYSPPPETTTRPRRTPRKLSTPSDWFAQQSTSLAEPPEGVAAPDLSPDEEPEEVLRDIAKSLTNWAKANSARLKLDPAVPIAVRGFHPVHRTAASGELLLEMVAHFVQTQKSSEDLGGLKYRAGVTLIANIDGQIRYLIDKPFHPTRQDGLRAWVGAFDETNDDGWPDGTPDPNRLTAAFSARAMDRKRWR
ncbi:MAG: peptidase GluZincin family protein [Gammaproteobacteria bacterium]|nr:peptidase GluZincin family protein [Gammaproteobacteria bacterium]